MRDAALLGVGELESQLEAKECARSMRCPRKSGALLKRAAAFSVRAVRRYGRQRMAEKSCDGLDRYHPRQNIDKLFFWTIDEHTIFELEKEEEPEE